MSPGMENRSIMNSDYVSNYNQSRILKNIVERDREQVLQANLHRRLEAIRR
jgi:hypothetical protein